MTTKSFHGPILLILAAALVAFSARPAAAQEVVPPPEARPSPMAVAQTTLNDGTYVVVRYSSPRKRGREIFGGLEPYDAVWRLGANEATEMTVTQDVRFGGTRLPAGTYSLFAIPGEEQWTLIVNSNLGQWGAFSYDAEGDVARIDVPVEHTDRIFEAFTISLEPNDDETAAALSMVWDQTRVTLPIESID